RRTTDAVRATAGEAEGAAVAAPSPTSRPTPVPAPAAATSTARNPSNGAWRWRWRSRPAPVPEGRRTAHGQEEGLRLLQRAHSVGRLQGREPAPAVHVRPGQDPRPPGFWQLRPAPTRRGRGHQDGARTGPPAVQPAHGGRAR